MSMNIKNPTTHHLARQLAHLTGESLTEAVTVAVRERLDRVRATDDATRVRADALLLIGRDTAPRLREPARSTDHGVLLYDDRGLPR